MFPFDNNEVIQVQKQQFKKVLKQLFEHELKYQQTANEYNDDFDNEKTIANFKITVVDPRKERLDYTQNLIRKKEHQVEEQRAHINKQVTFMDREKVAQKFDALKQNKMKMKM